MRHFLVLIDDTGLRFSIRILIFDKSMTTLWSHHRRVFEQVCVIKMYLVGNCGILIAKPCLVVSTLFIQFIYIKI